MEPSSPLQPHSPSFLELRRADETKFSRRSISYGDSTQPLQRSLQLLPAPLPSSSLCYSCENVSGWVMDDNKNNQLVTDLITPDSDLSRPKVSKGLTVVNEKGTKAVHLIRNENPPGPMHWPHSEVFKKEQSPPPPNTRTSRTCPSPHRVTDLLTPNRFSRLRVAGTRTTLWLVPSPVPNPSPQHTEEREKQLTRYLKPTAEPRSGGG